jgi:hypothetical protein
MTSEVEQAMMACSEVDDDDDDKVSKSRNMAQPMIYGSFRGEFVLTVRMNTASVSKKSNFQQPS